MQKDKIYQYVFSNEESHLMSPIDAHKYAHKKKIDILKGPGYREGKRERFTGWGWHDSLLRTFKGPKDYRDYLKANDMIEAGINDCPSENTFEKPIWTEELIRKAINHHGIDIGGVMAQALLSGELDYPELGSEEE